MKISYNWLQTYIEDKLPAVDVLAQKITFHMCEVEGVEKVGEDSVLDVNVLPDRAPYALSHRGIAGEVSAILNLATKKQTAVVIPKASLAVAPIRIDDEDLCSRYCARLIQGITVTASPDSLKQPLETIGQRSINTIVDVTNYVLFDIGQPLHAFDADKVKGTLVLRRAKVGEKITILDGREITLDESMLLEADDEGPLAIAGIKGGKRAEITADTRNIILVGGVFNNSSVRKTSMKIGIRSDASKRFENGLSIELQPEAVDHATKLILDFNPGASVGALADAYPKPVAPKVITAKLSDITAVLGIDLPDTEIISILERLSMKVAKKGDELTISVPSNRLDIRDWRDIPEEVGRLYGYAQIKATAPVISNIQPRVEKTFYYAEKIKNALIDAGFSEVYTYSLVATGVWEIEKPLAADKNHLRTNLTDGITKSLEMNARNADLLGLNAITIFEIGKVFVKDGEYTSLCVGIKHIKKTKGADQAKEKIKKVRDEVLKIIESNASILCTVDDSGGLISVNGETIGTTNNSDGIFELNLDKLVTVLADPISYTDLNFSRAISIEYKKFSLFPFIVRDIAVFVLEGIEADQVWKSVEQGIADAGATQIVARHSLFDTFNKEGKVSYAFRIVFQSSEKTLTDDGVNIVMEKVYGEIKKKGWEVR